MIEKQIKVAFIHDWLIAKGGAENLLLAMLEHWPGAPLFTLVHDPAGPTGADLKGHQIITSFMQKIPGITKHYRSFLALMPLAIEQFDLSSYNLIISSSHAVAKGVLTGPDQLHVSYIHSPIRYAWDMQHEYLEQAGLKRGIKSIIARWILHYIRNWDFRTANGVDAYIANSEFIARRIWKIYRRTSTVIYPPVDVESFQVQSQKEDYYLTASRMVPYKRIDLIVKAFSKMPEKKLVVIGDGPDYNKIKVIATKNVELLGYQPFDILSDHLKRTKAFVFAAQEDFGIVPVEAQACGTPVIAYGKGGALETIIDGKTGIFFKEQKVENLMDAINRFESIDFAWNPQIIRRNAERFSKDRFQKEIQEFIENTWKDFINKTV